MTGTSTEVSAVRPVLAEMGTKEGNTLSMQNSYQRTSDEVIRDVLRVLRPAPGVSVTSCVSVQAGAH